jgi:IS5 family transposase
VTRRQIGLKGFADMMIADISKPSVLDELNKVVDFHEIGQVLEGKLRKKNGRPSYPAEMMLKVTLLQVMYNLSDEKMEEALSDRLSFRRFCGFSLQDTTPDNATICSFRNLLNTLAEDILEKVNLQLDAHGMRLRKGTLVDATIIKSNSKNPTGGEVSERDPEAGWTKKTGQYHHGYKAHVGMDKDSGLINKVIVTSADIHDSFVTYECVDRDDQEVYADKAYDSELIRKELRKHKIKPRLMYRIFKSDTEQTKQRKTALNKSYGKKRGSVEKFFGTAKQSYGIRQARYLGIAKNQLHIQLVAICYNIKRAVNIMKTLNIQPT